MSKRLLVVGLDGAEWDLIRRWTGEGKLPTFKRLVDNGAWGLLRSTIPPHSAPAWTSAFTGVNPGKHNIFDFCASEGYDLRLVSATDRKAKAVWEILSEKGLKVIVVNVPMTYPPDKVNGVMISGILGAPNGLPGMLVDYTYPREVQDKLAQIGYVQERAPKKEEDYQLAFEAIEKMRQVVVDFVQSEDWNLFITVFRTLDPFQHFFWKHINAQTPYRDVILQIYKALDKVLQELLELIGENTNLILLSDHGFGPVHKDIALNNWFEYLGLIKKIETSKRGSLNEKLTAILKKIPHRLPDKMKGPFRVRRKRKGLSLKGGPVYGAPPNTEWSKTKAWLEIGGVSARVTINLRGRQPLGIVDPGKKYEDLRNYIIKKLYELRDPDTSEKVIEMVLKREEIYYGTYVKNGPDLYVKPKPGYVVTTRGFEGPIFGKVAVSGTHTPYGVFIAYGPDIKKGHNIKEAQITDIAPTILHMMGTPIPRAMDGKVLTKIFAKKSELYTKTVQYEDFKEETRETRPKKIFTKEEEEEIKERLKRLGYI